MKVHPFWFLMAVLRTETQWWQESYCNHKSSDSCGRNMTDLQHCFKLVYFSEKDMDEW